MTDLEGHWYEEQSWEETQKISAQVKERKKANHEGEDLFLLHVPSKRAAGQPTCGVRRSISQCPSLRLSSFLH